MRLVIQRVSEAKVTVKETGKMAGQIGKGYFVLLGVSPSDGLKDAEILADKLSKLRIMSDQAGKMNLSVKDVGAGVLVVSQFTLYADTGAGNRPSFIGAAEPKLAEEVYKHFIECLKDKGVKVEAGSFGSYMEIETKLDGPVTIIIS